MPTTFSARFEEQLVNGVYRWVSTIDQSGDISAPGDGSRMQLLLTELVTRLSEEALGAAINALSPGAPTSWDSSITHGWRLREAETIGGDPAIVVELTSRPKSGGAKTTVYYCAVPTEGSTGAQKRTSAHRDMTRAICEFVGHDTLQTSIAAIDVLAL